MEQKRPADIFQELLDYLWKGLGLEEKGWKRLKKGDFKKKMKNGLTYQIWFDRRRYNYIDYEIGHGNVEVGFTCIIKQGDDRLYSFKIEPTTGGSFFRMLTEDLRLNTRLLDTFLPLIKAHYSYKIFWRIYWLEKQCICRYKQLSLCAAAAQSWIC